MLTLVVLNGYPGVGKSTVGQELRKILPNARFISNHLSIDTTAALYDRLEPEFPLLRKELRQAVLRSIVSRGQDDSRTIIFTEALADNPPESAMMQDYIQLKNRLEARLVSVILECSVEVNEARLVGRGPSQSEISTKLLDPEILRSIRRKETIFTFGDDADLELRLGVNAWSIGETVGYMKERLEQLGGS